MEELQNNNKKPLIIIGGPTASGKSDIAVKLAECINGQIISADSMQVYRYMDIGSAKITKDEMHGITHYGIDELEPTEDFNVVFFQNMAKNAMEKIYSEGAIPIITGGTGFYIQSVIYDIDFTVNDGDLTYRDQLNKIFQEKGSEYLHNMLKEIDPESAGVIHPNNSKRIIRALEFYNQTGTKISEHNEEQKQKVSPYNYVYFALTDDREQLYSRINRRVDIMLEKGLVSEVQKLKNMGISRNAVSMQGIGYKEIFDYLEGLSDFDKAVEDIKQGSRNYAKRQLTWLRREKDVCWLDRSELKNNENILSNMLETLKTHGIKI